MSFRDFTYPNVEAELGLNSTEGKLFGDVEPLRLSPEVIERLRATAELGLAMYTEKARSEFIIAPLLFELRILLGSTFGLFSGIALDVDTARGLNGFCDFLLTRSPTMLKLTAPSLAIVEAKADQLRSGLGQCIAATVAAREYNALENRLTTLVYGAVTTGSAWQFLRLEGSALTIDPREYPIGEPGRLLAILSRIVA